MNWSRRTARLVIYTTDGVLALNNPTMLDSSDVSLNGLASSVATPAPGKASSDCHPRAATPPPLAHQHCQLGHEERRTHGHGWHVGVREASPEYAPRSCPAPGVSVTEQSTGGHGRTDNAIDVAATALSARCAALRLLEEYSSSGRGPVCCGPARATTRAPALWLMRRARACVCDTMACRVVMLVVPGRTPSKYATRKRYQTQCGVIAGVERRVSSVSGRSQSATR